MQAHQLRHQTVYAANLGILDRINQYHGGIGIIANYLGKSLSFIPEQSAEKEPEKQISAFGRIDPAPFLTLQTRDGTLVRTPSMGLQGVISHTALETFTPAALLGLVETLITEQLIVNGYLATYEIPHPPLEQMTGEELTAHTDVLAMIIFETDVVPFRIEHYHLRRRNNVKYQNDNKKVIEYDLAAHFLANFLEYLRQLDHLSAQYDGNIGYPAERIRDAIAQERCKTRYDIHQRRLRKLKTDVAFGGTMLAL